MGIQNIVIITSRYPSADHPMDGAFVQQFVTTLTSFGIRCTVVHPVPVHKRLGKSSKALHIFPQRLSSNDAIYRPGFVSFSSRKIGRLDTEVLTQLAFDSAVRRALRVLDVMPDAFYGHFLYLSGSAAVRLGISLNKPSFVGVGESYLDRFSNSKRMRAQRDFQNCTGFLAVSEANKRFLVSNLRFSEERVKVFNNGVDLTHFYPRNKFIAREALGIPRNLFVVAFVGTFSHNKGVLRVTEALHGLENIGAILVGEGPLRPDGDNVIFRGSLPHESVPEVLAAADIFVLPTLSEGCGNAILEALACGLPVVSSLGEFNDDILNESVSIRVDPLNIIEIRNAISHLKDSPALQERMSKNAIEWARKFDINLRANRIVNWMDDLIGKVE